MTYSSDRKIVSLIDTLATQNRMVYVRGFVFDGKMIFNCTLFFIVARQIRAQRSIKKSVHNLGLTERGSIYIDRNYNIINFVGPVTKRVRHLGSNVG